MATTYTARNGSVRGGTVEREKALEVALLQIEKQFGKGAVMRMGEASAAPVEAIPTGSLALDLALGIGGVPRGRVVEIYGPEGSGKTSVSLHIIAEAQRAGGIAAFIDAEHALDVAYARNLGINTDELLISQPDTGEQALEIADMLIRSGAIDVVVIDSVAALVPRAEIEGEMGDSHVGLQARLMSQALRKLTGTISKSKTTAIFINQLREKVGILFGNPETTPGGRALKFYSSVRLDIRRIESLKDGAEVVGNRTRVKVVKNKCVAAGTTVFDPTTGLTHRIEDVVDAGAGASVIAADKLGQLHVRPIVGRMDQGEQKVIGLHLRDGTALWVTPDHKVLTERGWRQAGQLTVDDRVARPRRAFGFGNAQPVPPDHARLLGYLIGDGHVGGKTPITFINQEESLQQDAIAIAASMGCNGHRDGIETSFSHRPGEKNELLALARWAGIWGHLAPTKRIPAPFFASDASAEVVGNLLFGIFESAGWISREQTGGIRCGFTTTSEQLARQLHWLLLRWGIGSSVRPYDPTTKRPSIIDGRRVAGKLPRWEVRVSGIDNISRFADAIPMWGPRGRALTAEPARPEMRKHRGSQMAYLPSTLTEPVIAHLRNRGVTPLLAAELVGEGAGDPRGGLSQILGHSRLRRDRVQRLADALEDEFLAAVLDEDLWYARVVAVSPPEPRRTFDIEVEELHNFVADDVVVHNCAPPFRQAEFDILYGQGISKEGSLLDVGVDVGLIKKSGAWFTYEGDQLGQGRENARNFLRDNPELAREIEEKVKAQLGIGVPVVVSGDGVDPDGGKS
ncbi:MAG TPA: intein-containing recombinase RecA [Actinomycetes bacterium]|nr:intein-containing recombinase RecA [Actinomycetes bacterium]